MSARTASLGFAVVLVAVATALLPACRREPDSLLYILGRITDEAGSPLTDTRVELLRNGSNECYGQIHGYPGLDGGTFEPFAEFDTNPRGDFLFELLQRDATSDDLATYRGPACFRVRVERDGSSSEVWFSYPEGDVELADLPVRTTEDTATADGAGGVSLQRAREVPLAGYSASLAGWEIRSGDAVAWVQPGDADAGVATLLPEMLEDFETPSVSHRALGVFARSPPPLFPGPYFYYLADVRGRRMALPPGTLTPLSRGAACAPHAMDAGTCGLTDGELEVVQFASETPQVDPTMPPQTPPDELRIDLGNAVAVSRMVLRGLRLNGPWDELWVEVSADGETWTKVGSLAGAPIPTTEAAWHQDTLRRQEAPGVFATVPLAVSEPVRYLRVRGREPSYPHHPDQGPPPEPGPIRFFGAQEVSVF